MNLDFDVQDIKRVTFLGVTKDMDRDEWAEFIEICKAFIELDKPKAVLNETLPPAFKIEENTVPKVLEGTNLNSNTEVKIADNNKIYISKDYTKYVKMHEDGCDIKAIRKQMLLDGFCKEGGLSWAVGQILKRSNRVSRIEEPKLTDEEKIERLKKKNAEKTKEQKKKEFTTGVFDA